MIWKFVNKLVAPQYCYRLLTALQPWLAGLLCVLFAVGLFAALLIAPVDAQQGEVYRILFLHVPAAVLSLLIYLVMTIAAVMYQVWRIKLADMIASVSAPLGAFFTCVTLVTGSLWGRPTWGTYWIWDARLTSELILLFIYCGIIALRRAIPDPRLAANASGLLTIAGVINLPIVHYSVQWWHTLHQGATVLRFARPAIASTMLWPLLVMLLAYLCFYGYLLCLQLRREILLRESGARWLQHHGLGE